MNAPKPRILVIDDTPANLLTLGAALKNDYDLQIATSGAMGLAQALQSPPDLILLDVMMPEMDGFEVCRRLKADPRLSAIPVVFVTALQEHESEVKGLELGALDYITKPIQVDTARQRIRNLLEQERLRQEVVVQRDLLKAEITERKQAELSLQRNLRFTQAINQIAQAIITSDEVHVIFQATTAAIGQALQVDRAMLYELSFTQRLGMGLCEWLNPAQPDIPSTLANYPLEVFLGGVTEIVQTHQPLISHANHINPFLAADGSGNCLHGPMQVQSLLWYPFNFTKEDFHILVVNQVYAQRDWMPEDISFLSTVGQQVTLALEKLQLLAERQRNQAQLHLSASVFASAREGIAITDTEGVILDVNAAFTRITGYSRDDALGKKCNLLDSDQLTPEFCTQFWQQLRDQGEWSGELWSRRKNGELYAKMLNVSTARDAKGQPQNHVALFSDITASKKHEQELDRIAHFDALTGLPNRVLLADRLRQGMAQAVRRNQQLAVVFLDLDGFKAVNDTHGHEAGDHLLITIAQRMKQTLREGDTLARIGGDEFLAVLVDLNDSATSIPMMQRLLEAASLPLQHHEATLKVSASLGVSFYPQVQDLDAEQLMRQADQAMYQAKMAGKNRFHLFDAVRDSGLRSHRESQARIHQALQTRELVLYYQPKVNLRTGQVIGVEALIRWQHPVLGLEAPAQFLPTIEDNPLAVAVGEWVMETALTQVGRWQEQGLTMPVSVNVGTHQLLQSDFVPHLRALLLRHPGITPGTLELEVVETSALEDIATVSQVIEHCQAMGVSFAFDDFGTGYASLACLKQLAVTQLKIDPSFVRDMLKTPDDLAILEGVISLAHGFKRQVIAEGVETSAQGARLLQLGCELAQGFAIARPMPAHELPHWLSAWTPDPAWQVATAA